MNRILTAEVILTLTREQARSVFACVLFFANVQGQDGGVDVAEDSLALADLIVAQCLRQGVQL
jgi:hypothetical protein